MPAASSSATRASRLITWPTGAPEGTREDCENGSWTVGRSKRRHQEKIGDPEEWEWLKIQQLNQTAGVGLAANYRGTILGAQPNSLTCLNDFLACRLPSGFPGMCQGGGPPGKRCQECPLSFSFNTQKGSHDRKRTGGGADSHMAFGATGHRQSRWKTCRLKPFRALTADRTRPEAASLVVNDAHLRDKVQKSRGAKPGPAALETGIQFVPV